jgi:hypothetical protein
MHFSVDANYYTEPFHIGHHLLPELYFPAFAGDLPMFPPVNPHQELRQIIAAKIARLTTEDRNRMDLLTADGGLLEELALALLQYDRPRYDILRTVWNPSSPQTHVPRYIARFWTWKAQGRAVLRPQWFDFFSHHEVLLRFAPLDVQQAVNNAAQLRPQGQAVAIPVQPMATRSLSQASPSSVRGNQTPSSTNLARPLESLKRTRAQMQQQRSTSDSVNKGSKNTTKLQVEIDEPPRKKKALSAPSKGSSRSSSNVKVDSSQSNLSRLTPVARPDTQEDNAEEDEYQEEPSPNSTKRKREAGKKRGVPRYGAPYPEGRPSRPFTSKTVKYRTSKGPANFGWSQGHINAWQLANPDTQLPGQAEAWDVSPLNSVCAGASVNIKYLGDFDVSGVEILTYFPLHTIWRAPCWRLMSHGWIAVDIAKFQLWSRDITDFNGVDRTVYQHQFKHTREWAGSSKAIKASDTDLKLGEIDEARGFHNANRNLEDYRLIDLADGVAHTPTGGDKGVLTAAIEHAVAVKNESVMLSGQKDYINDYPQIIVGLMEMPQTVDKNGLERHRARFDEYADKIGYEPQAGK